MKTIFHIFLFLSILSIQLALTKSRAKYVWRHQVEKDNNTEVDRQQTTQKNLTKENSLKLKTSSKKKTQSENTIANESNIKRIINNKTSKGEEPERIAQQKIINEVRYEKVKDVFCMDSKSKMRKGGEEWKEKEDCNSCSCICRPNGRQSCFCTRMGCYEKHKS